MTIKDAINKIMLWQKIPERFKDTTLRDLQGSSDYKTQLLKISEWNFKDPNIICLLSSNNGMGKTHIAWSLIKKYIAQLIKDKNSEQIYKIFDSGKSKYSNFFWKEYEILNYIKATYTAGSIQTEQQAKDYLINREILVIDDLFRTKVSEWTISILFEIIDKRWETMKPTIITSNYLIKEIYDIDTSFASRINNRGVFEFTETLKDWRKEK